MGLYKSYKGPNTTYKVFNIKEDQVEEHCNRYMDSITGLSFHGSEVLHQLSLMKEAVKSGMAYEVFANSNSCGYIYAIPVGGKRYNLIALYTQSPQGKAILVHELYSLNKILRYTPRDPKCSLHRELLQPVSMRMFTESRVEIIKMNNNVNTLQNLTDLQLSEV